MGCYFVLSHAKNPREMNIISKPKQDALEKKMRSLGIHEEDIEEKV